MRAVGTIALSIAMAALARADFSYTVTRTNMGGMMGGMMKAAPGVTKMYYKGQKLKVDLGDTATIIDFDAQTVTSLNSRAKTATVRKFTDIQAGVKDSGVDLHAEVKDTGQKRTINGFACSELLLTMDMESQMGKAQIEIDNWISPDVPGVEELKAFYRKNAANFPWSAIASGGNQSLQQSMAEMTKKVAAMNGVQVQQTIRMKAPAMAGALEAQSKSAQPGVAQARTRLEAMIAQGGPAAAVAKQALARLSGGDSAQSGGAPLLEMTMESGDFSTAPIPDSVFATPAAFIK